MENLLLKPPLVIE
jgi:hypothetical protein